MISENTVAAFNKCEMKFYPEKSQQELSEGDHFLTSGMSLGNQSWLGLRAVSDRPEELPSCPGRSSPLGETAASAQPAFSTSSGNSTPASSSTPSGKALEIPRDIFWVPLEPGPHTHAGFPSREPKKAGSVGPGRTRNEV